ncbi:MAG: NAD-glutamate dehydrogenase [Pseudomonadota bacterium]
MPQTRRNQDRQSDFIARIIAAVRDVKPFKDRRQWRRFVSEYYRNLSIEDAESRGAASLARAALSHIRAGRRLAASDYHLRVYNPDEKKHGWTSGSTIVELVHRNMPFLVDSLSMALNRLGYAVQMTVHPLIRVNRTEAGTLRSIEARDAGSGEIESFIRFEIRKETRAEQLDLIRETLADTLQDVTVAVRDWRKMRGKMQAAIGDAEAQTRMTPALRDESINLLHWLLDNMYTFLGYREYRMAEEDGKRVLKPVKGSALGLTTRGRRSGRTQELTKAMHRFRRAEDLILITKVSTRSTVHRASYLDYVGIKMFDDRGRVVGERRFIGLLTSQAYNTPPDEIPLVRGKITEIIKRAGLDPTGHRGKALIHILNNFPRDELFQASVSDLFRTTTGILNLQDRRRVKFFIRRDTFRRFYSCLVYIPREQYNTEVRQKTEQILRDHLDASNIEFSVQMSDSALARVHLLAHAPTDKHRRVSIKAIEAAISEAVITWRDRLRDALIEDNGFSTGADLFERFERVFPLAYEEDVDARRGASDLKQVDAMLNGMPAPLSDYQLELGGKRRPERVVFRVFRKDSPIALSDVLPLLENLGMRVISERPYQLRTEAPFWIQEFELEPPAATTRKTLRSNRHQFAESFALQLSGAIESDGLNKLIAATELDSHDVSLLRTYAKYLLQLGLPFSQAYLEDILCDHAPFAAAVINWFKYRFTPAGQLRTSRIRKLESHVDATIEQATSLDADRALRAIYSAMRATVRCNFFADDGTTEAIAIKLETRNIEEAPLPRPAHEIFVYSTRVEGVHLRAGDVARGGLRWSDRREDFRTEVLGLMKAQTVKNTVIVPTGAKGGFYPKQLPSDGSRDDVFAEVTACYKIFINALLSVTDNIIDGTVVAPKGVRRLDGDDPYLVVAADKGTATFSDTANAIAVGRDFWLGDAFASGGSAGYDHKKMAITARGAWEAVKRHFREMGVDTQSDRFTVAGIGDMSGDVFGNGMLLSRSICLVAAFNHQHIFIDPDPDPARSFEERERLFALPRSGWADYDATIISDGGGIFERSAKSIPLTDQMRALLKTDAERLSPPALIQLILKMPVDLLWNGGIGTYVKATAEANADVGDPNNNALRIDASELACKVVGEGGNLGLTQRGRIEFALAGGRINTDFIDNSAGVDSSDREVNIKILMRDVMDQRRFSMKQRNQLLSDMTDEVAELVLRNNYLQTQAISMMEASAKERLSEHREVINGLERSGLLNRKLEAIPDDEMLDERHRVGAGLSRPELSVLLSYAKLDVYQDLSKSTRPLDDNDKRELIEYFPSPLRRRFATMIESHQLGRQITDTLLTNSIVNRMGPAFVIRAKQDTGYDINTVVSAYEIARAITDARGLWQDIEALDHRVPTNVQYAMMFAISRKLRHACYWLMRTSEGKLDTNSMVSSIRTPLKSVLANLTEYLPSSGKQRLRQLTRQHETMGVPDALARRVSSLTFINDALEIVRIAELRQCDTDTIARVYFALGKRLQLDWVRSQVDRLAVDGRWQSRARGTLRDNIIRAQREFTMRVHSLNQCKASAASIDDLIASDRDAFDRTGQLIEQMQERGNVDFATLTVAVDELTQLSQPSASGEA